MLEGRYDLRLKKNSWDPHIEPIELSGITSGDIDIERAAADVLGSTRMNWNSAQNTNSQPVTLRFARQVGGIMAEVAEGEERPSCYYWKIFI
jgi:hypothetical protein